VIFGLLLFLYGNNEDKHNSIDHLSSFSSGKSWNPTGWFLNRVGGFSIDMAESDPSVPTKGRVCIAGGAGILTL
jgi:hypothetical protein